MEKAIDVKKHNAPDCLKGGYLVWTGLSSLMCSGCGASFTMQPRNKDMVICEYCESEINKALARKVKK